MFNEFFHTLQISIVVCTYNRAESLKRTLNSFLEMTVPDNLSWELLVIDNNSKDHTKFTVEEFIDKRVLPIHYFFEKQQGLSYARNRGIREAAGKIIAFTDDDVLLDRLWLMNILRAFNDHDAACVGGKILPIWEKTPPKWLHSEFHGSLALLDLGDDYIRMTKPTLWGANFAVASEIFKKYGLFNTDAGRTPSKLYGFEETYFIDALIKKQEKVIYSPFMVVHHCIPETRMKKSYFRKWNFDQGEYKGLQISRRNIWKLTKYFLWALRAIIIGMFKFLWVSTVKPEKALRQELRIIYNMGFFVGLVKCMFITKHSPAMLITPKA